MAQDVLSYEVLDGQISMWDENLDPAVDSFPEEAPADDTFPSLPIVDGFLSAPDGSVLPAEGTQNDPPLDVVELVALAQSLARHGWVVFPPGFAPQERKKRLRARLSDPATSAAGALSVTRRAGSQAHKLLRAYASAGSYGLTAYAAGHNSGLAANPNCGYWKRCSELLEDGLLETVMENGQPKTRMNEATGDHQEVRRITPAGMVELTRLNDAATKKESRA